MIRIIKSQINQDEIPVCFALQQTLDEREQVPVTLSSEEEHEDLHEPPDWTVQVSWITILSQLPKQQLAPSEEVVVEPEHCSSARHIFPDLLEQDWSWIFIEQQDFAPLQINSDWTEPPACAQAYENSHDLVEPVDSQTENEDEPESGADAPSFGQPE